MKLLLDECIDRRLAGDLPGREVKTVPQMGWAGKKNGELLALAEAGFEVFVTVDRNLSFQQNLPAFKIAVLVLHAPSNTVADSKPLAPKILAVLPAWREGTAEHAHA